MLQRSFSTRFHVDLGPLPSASPSPSSSSPSLLFPSTTGSTTTTTRHPAVGSSRTSHSSELLVSPTQPAQEGFNNSPFVYANIAPSSSSSSPMSAPQTSVSTPVPPPSQAWPPSLLPSTARNAAQFEAYTPLNLGADEDEQVWTGESVGLGFGLVTKGKATIDAVNWDCRICEKTANDPCVTRCGHLFCWSHLREHLTALSATCPTCKVPTRMDRDVVQVFGRPKVVPADAPWTSGAGSGASTCSFGPMSGGNPSVIDLAIQSELPGPVNFDDESPYLVAQNQIYIPVLSTLHSREMSLSRYPRSSTLGLDINLSNPVSSPSPEATLFPPPPSSPVLTRFELSSSPVEYSPIDANHPSGLSSLPLQPGYEDKRRASAFSWLSASGTSGPGSMQLSQSGSSLWDGESSYGSRSRSNTIDLRDEREDEQPLFEPIAPRPRRISFTSRPMKGFWATKTPTRWLPPKMSVPEEEPAAPLPPPPRIEIRAATLPPHPSSESEDTPGPSSRLRTRGWRPGSSVFTLAPAEPRSQAGAALSSDSEDHLSRFRPQRYDRPSGGEPSSSRRDEPQLRSRTPSRKVFRNMDVDFPYGGQMAAAAAREAAQKAVDDEQNPLGRAMMLLALALFLMVLLK